MAKLTGKQRKQLSDAILDAFDLNDLRRLLVFQLDKNLDRISSPAGSLPDIVLDVIQASERVGWDGRPAARHGYRASRPARHSICPS